MNIVFLDSATLSIGDIDFTGLSNLGSLKMFDRTTPELIVKRSLEADVIITNKVVIDKDVLDQLPNLKYICVAATGYNVVDVNTARSKNIAVSNVSGYSTSGVVQHVFALLFAILNKIQVYNTEVQNGKWQNALDFTFYNHSIHELAGKTLGVYGYGTIGRSVADIGRAFGMNILATRRNPTLDSDLVSYVDTRELFQRSDIVSLHAPLNNDSKEVVNYDLLSKMKSTAILINSARGGLINENDLARALKENIIAGAGLDVLTHEPPSKNHPLIGIQNCIVTPHQAWASVESRKRLLEGLVNNIANYKKGNILNKVN